ncbi:MAG TPA: LLM class flavin-dependent oxidoreductase [Acidimicrobiales bacterium]|nr:LLM class flavin-dependent oxidoreductase [Acidimicrobiales bacterium]
MSSGHVGTVGVTCHLLNPTLDEVADLARASEAVGADWVGLPDAFWWRDTWLLVGAALEATDSIPIGPMVTNPFLRHPFHTAAAVATLQDRFGDRVILGLAAGGSEVSGAAGVDRGDAAERIADLVTLFRRLGEGGPLDEASGRSLEVPMRPVPITIAGRGNKILRVGGRMADHVLLWAIPDSDLDRIVAVIRSGGEAPLVWAPLVDLGDEGRERARVIAAYGVLNASKALRASWGVDDEHFAAVRAALVRGGASNAVSLVPDHVLDDILVPDPDPKALGARARSIGATDLAVPAFSIDSVADRVAWARAVLAAS